MKIVIEHEGSNVLIVLPVECAAVAAQLLANAVIYKPDDYPRHQNLTRSDEGLLMRFDDSERFTPANKATLEAQEAVQKSQASWHKEYTARNAAEKELAETKAALEALRSVTVCSVTEPAPAEEAEPEREEEGEELEP